MKRKNTNNFTNRFTGEKLSVYPVITFGKCVSKRTGDVEKLQKQRENFSQKYLCPICGQPKNWIQNTNLMVCQNESCKGFPIKNKDGEVIGYKPSFSQLNQRGAEIAATLFE